MTTLNARTADVTLYQGDDRAKIQELSELVGAAETKRRAAKKLPQLLAGEDFDGEVEAAVKRYNAAVTAGKKRALTVTLTAIGYRAWRTLKREHPAREDEPEDKLIGQNFDTFPLAAILACWQDDSVADREAKVEGLCEADFLLLFSAAKALNTSQGFDPKAVTASDVTLVNDGM